MAKRKLRKDQTCLNCGAHVESRFCPECGQENVVNRPGTWYLIGTFFEDLFSYDSRFWLTIRTLLFKPGKIIADFLKGHRKSYVPPVRLYIFASFLTFLLPLILPEIPSQTENYSKDVIVYTEPEYLEPIKEVKEKERAALFDSLHQLVQSKKQIDSLDYARLVAMAERFKQEDSIKTQIDSFQKIDIGDGKFVIGDLSLSEAVDYNEHYKNMHTVKDFDSIHQSLSKADRLNPFMRAGLRKVVELKERSVKEQQGLGEAFLSTFMSALPKALIFYLPIFAWVLWLFHSKKKWKYYDHAVFTLYYFSFLFVLIIAGLIIKQIVFLPTTVLGSFHLASQIIYSLFFVTAFFYAVFYFYRSHRKIFKESFWRSGLKSTMILGINFWLLLLSFFLFMGIVVFLI